MNSQLNAQDKYPSVINPLISYILKYIKLQEM